MCFNMSKKTGLIYNLSWKFFERISAQMVSLIVSVILARLLSPSDYGVVAIVTIFITFANVFVSDGFGSALMQKKNADELDFSSVLYFGFFVSIAIYILLFFVSPAISKFYGEDYEILTPVLRVLGLTIIVTSINSVQQAYVARKMIFKKFFFSTLGATLISAVVGIYMAYRGFGVWALVGQYLTNSIVATVILAFIVPWKLKLQFSFKRVKALFAFGSKILGATLLSTLYREIRALIVGKRYTTNDLAYYTKSKQFPEIITVNIISSLTAVLFPRIAQEQDDLQRVKKMTQQVMRMSSYVISPMLLGLAAVSKTFIEVLLTEKWLACAPLLQLFCIEGLFLPLHSANMQALKAIGKSDVYLKLEIVKKIIELIILLIVMWFGVNWIVIGMVITSFIFTFVNAGPNARLLNYKLTEQLGDILPPILMSAVMFAIVNIFNYISLPLILKLFIQVALGILIYLAESVIIKYKQFYLIKDMILSKIKKN